MKGTLSAAFFVALALTAVVSAASLRPVILSPGNGEAAGAVVELATFGSGQADDINQWGLVTGSTDTESGWRRAFITWPHGPLRLLGSLGHPYSIGIGINDFGDVVGESFTSEGLSSSFAQIGTAIYDLGLRSVADINNRRVAAGWTDRQAALWRRGRALELLLTPTIPPGDESGKWWSGALGGINDRGQAAGFYVDETGTAHAVRWEPDGTITELGFGSPTAINEAGDVAGWGYNTPNFLYRDGIGRISVELYPLALNDAGQLAGLCGNDTPEHDPCVWSETTGIVRLAKPVAGYARATGINDLGEVVGHLGEWDGAGHALWWYAPPPVPDQLAAAERLLRVLRHDGVLNHGRHTTMTVSLKKSARAWNAGSRAAAAKHLVHMGKQLAAWRKGGGAADRLVHVEALVTRLAMRLRDAP